jgi:hypothetical protein
MRQTWFRVATKRRVPEGKARAVTAPGALPPDVHAVVGSGSSSTSWVRSEPPPPYGFVFAGRVAQVAPQSRVYQTRFVPKAATVVPALSAATIGP